ncbi:MAG TPA: hypothetical protein VKS20_15165 [Candidatus Acidoferrales bacterium]|nr:hypothetical protein [Candidatus Acidoferrales bacterium]
MGPVTSKLQFPSRVLTLALSLIVCTVSASAKNKKDKKAEQAEAQALLDKAAALTNIEAPGSQPFVYIANTSWTENGKTTKGLFGVAWQRVDRYREQIAFPGFMQTEVVSGDKLYRARNTEPMQLLAMRWLSMFPVWNHLGNRPKKGPTISSAHPPKELANAKNFACVTATVADTGIETAKLTVCFDNSTGLPLLSQQRYGDNTVTQAFSNYAALGDKYFPREITYADSAGNRGEMKASRLDVFTTFAESTFQPPPNSMALPWCAQPTFKNPLANDPVFMHIQKWIPAEIPDLNEPYIFIMVNSKGRVQKVFFMGTPPNFQEQDAANDVYGSQLPIKYCGKEAIPYETFLQLGRRVQ